MLVVGVGAGIIGRTAQVALSLIGTDEEHGVVQVVARSDGRSGGQTAGRAAIQPVGRSDSRSGLVRCMVMMMHGSHHDAS